MDIQRDVMRGERTASECAQSTERSTEEDLEHWVVETESMSGHASDSPLDEKLGQKLECKLAPQLEQMTGLKLDELMASQTEPLRVASRVRN
jgi:hypothetical protein